MFSPAIAELAPGPYLALDPKDMKHLTVANGDTVIITGKGDPISLPVRQVESLPAGVAGLPFGLPGMKWFDYSAKYRIVPAVEKDS
jgi:NADH-quinone oxidoreductase subunit G